MELQPIVTRKVYQEIIAQFVEMLRNDKIRIGEKLPSERILADMFQVSRPSVREALRVMETIGLVDIRAGGGAYVTELNIAPFLNMFAPLIVKHRGFELELLDLRELLEVKAVGLAAACCDSESADYLLEPITRMSEALEINDPNMGAKYDIDFHTRILAISDNFILRKASEFVNSLIQISIKGGRHMVLENVENAAQLYEDHRLIYEAIRNNDPKLAESRMSAHIEMVKKIYRKAE